MAKTWIKRILLLLGGIFVMVSLALALLDGDGVPSASENGQTSENAPMSLKERDDNIRKILERADEKLREQPDNIQAWQDLISSYMRINEEGKATDALARALDNFGPGTDERNLLTALAKELKLDLPSNN